MLDKAHLWTVRSLLGLTVAGMGYMGLQIYSYFNVVRPQRKAEWDAARAEEMEAEQKEMEAERLRREQLPA